MVQILVAIGSAAGIAIRVSETELDSWFWAIIGCAIIYIAISLSKISDAIRANAIPLKEAGAAIGDQSLPDVSNPQRSVMHWLTIFTFAIGILFLIRGFIFG